jgi:integrase
MIQKYGERVFHDLKYPIEDYARHGEAVAQHWRSITTHGLRHIRATELIMHYGFDGIDLAIFCGWSLKKEVAMPSMATRYLHMQWIRYFPKLLKPPPKSL